MKASLGYCQCGCGEKTKIAKETAKEKHWIKGQPVRFIRYHHLHLRIGNHNPVWKGGTIITTSGYRCMRVKNHPFFRDGYVLEHRLIMANHLSRALFKSEIVHHKNGNKLDNRIDNLELINWAEHTRNHFNGKIFSDQWRKNLATSHQRIKISKKQLEQLYSTNKFSETRIARLLNCSRGCIHLRLKYYNLL